MSSSRSSRSSFSIISLLNPFGSRREPTFKPPPTTLQKLQKPHLTVSTAYENLLYDACELKVRNGLLVSKDDDFPWSHFCDKAYRCNQKLEDGSNFGHEFVVFECKPKIAEGVVYYVWLDRYAADPKQPEEESVTVAPMSKGGSDGKVVNEPGPVGYSSGPSLASQKCSVHTQPTPPEYKPIPLTTDEKVIKPRQVFDTFKLLDSPIFDKALKDGEYIIGATFKFQEPIPLSNIIIAARSVIVADEEYTMALHSTRFAFVEWILRIIKLKYGGEVSVHKEVSQLEKDGAILLDDNLSEEFLNKEEYANKLYEHSTKWANDFLRIQLEIS
ncbi:hypothetical protein SCHPADRAFT_935537 [Schizopora paradoxa]|uniref:Uncharacterized protein n=1 Tax=Schizopora paradoxa TaxID=27342 RepID=A0A0H2SQ65_9AGAM|nr:hypothetical protein SCHPADRAFT_935537 [Schizopora paradoxa]